MRTQILGSMIIAIFCGWPGLSQERNRPVAFYASTIEGDEAERLFHFFSSEHDATLIMKTPSKVVEAVELPKIACLKIDEQGEVTFRCIMQFDSDGNLTPADHNLIGISN